MAKTLKKLIVLSMGFVLFIPFSSFAEKKVYKVKTVSDFESTTDSIKQTEKSYIIEAEDPENVRQSFFNNSLDLDRSHFTWGAEVGSSLDMTAHDLSTFDADVLLGYKNSFLKLVGAGCGIHRSIHTGNYFIPVYGVIRTSFRSRPSLLFMDLQAGYSFNTISHNKTIGDFTGSVGLGINLQQSRGCKTYVVLAMAYQYFSEDNKNKIQEIDTNYIYFARLSLGINF